MNYFVKKYWNFRNLLEVLFWTFIKKSGSGLLKHRKDKRDYIFGIGLFRDIKPKYPYFTLAPKKWVFDQYPFNICVFASGVIGDSYQEGKRFSVKFAVKLARHLGMIKGNGWSYLRAYLDIATKYGRLPYELMPDETFGQTWEQYSKWDITDDMLKIAAEYKASPYEKVINVKDAIDALERGLVLRTANNWYSEMNEPSLPDFLLKIGGVLVGGHAWPVTGYRSENEQIKDYENLQSFGKGYGQDGYAHIVELFQRNNYPVYAVGKMVNRSDEERFLGVYEGLCVKGSDNVIYKIEDGTKRGIASWEAFKKMNQIFYNVSDEILVQIPTGQTIT